MIEVKAHAARYRVENLVTRWKPCIEQRDYSSLNSCNWSFYLFECDIYAVRRTFPHLLSDAYFATVSVLTCAANSPPTSILTETRRRDEQY